MYPDIQIQKIAVAICLSLIGGVANFAQIMRGNKQLSAYQCVYCFIAESFKSVSAGLLILFSCQWQSVDHALTMVLVLLAGGNSHDVLAAGRKMIIGRLGLVSEKKAEGK